MKTVQIKSKQPNITVKHEGEPSFKLQFEDKPLNVDIEIANFLVKDNSNFEIVDGTEKEVEVNLDLDGDGDVDKDDRSIAGKVLATGKKKRGNKE